VVSGQIGTQARQVLTGQLQHDIFRHSLALKKALIGGHLYARKKSKFSSSSHNAPQISLGDMHE
jgi:hypothetical protein